MIVGIGALLGLNAMTEGWNGVMLPPAVQAWLLPSPLPAIWTLSISLWTLVIVGGLLSEDRALRRRLPRPAQNQSALDESILVQDDGRTYIRLGRNQARSMLRVPTPLNRDRAA